MEAISHGILKQDASGVSLQPTPVAPSDITMVLSIRAHADNHWVLSRIDYMAEYYSPCPKVVIVDFGSTPPFKNKIAEICQNRGYRLVTIEDSGVFSLSQSRNAGFEAVETKFVFFCDPDFFGERDIFLRLAETASALNMHDTVDIVLNPPAYHLSKDDTERFEKLKDPHSQSLLLRSLGWRRNFSGFDKQEEAFIAPYSNVFMINRDMFSMVGGYDTSFRGHGSEDFEFLLRLAIHTSHLPLPEYPGEDHFGPNTSEFFQGRPYIGFRRLFELMSQPTESLGFKVFHLWHPRARQSDWYKNNDWKRNRFREASSAYLNKHNELLKVDHLSRAKKVLCVCKNEDTWGYFVPLRLAGYEIVPIFNDDPESVGAATKLIVDGEVHALAIFNPYMKSHSQFSPLLVIARELGRKIIVIERGALPKSVYFSNDVCYVDPAYSQEAFERTTFSEPDLAIADEYISVLRKGDATLEGMNSYSETEQKYSPLNLLNKKIVFIPLQLEDDMAVTMFIKGEQRYPDFVSGINALTQNNSDIVFIIKPHPLSKFDSLRMNHNVIIADRLDNIHYLLDLASATLCYNSGVGLLSLIHETPTITLGNAFYNYAGSGYRANSASEGIAALKSGSVPQPDRQVVRRIVSWFLHHKYSFFTAIDDIKDHGNRKSHGYSQILVTEFHLDDLSQKLHRMRDEAPFSWTSYSAARAAIGNESSSAQPISYEEDWKKFARWATKDFHSGHYAKASDFFIRAYGLNPSKHAYLRFAAEALVKQGRRREAIAHLTTFCQLNPSNRRARRRAIVLRYPLLAVVLGQNEMDVPKRV